MADKIAAPKLSRERLVELLASEFPEATHAVGDYDIEEIWYGGCRVRRRHHESSLRPGGTVSGPIMMALADFTMYLAVLSAIG
jgi:acyl-coenzyme A thioesterase PaaI-like protein